MVDNLRLYRASRRNFGRFFILESAMMQTKDFLSSAAEDRLAAGAGLSEVDTGLCRRLILKTEYCASNLNYKDCRWMLIDIIEP